MKNLEIKKGTLISAGNHLVSIGKYDKSDVAILSKHTGKFVKLERTKTNNKLKKVKRLFFYALNNDTDFVFEFLTDDKTRELISILKG
jgi:hypothetical protein